VGPLQVFYRGGQKDFDLFSEKFWGGVKGLTALQQRSVAAYDRRRKETRHGFRLFSLGSRDGERQKSDGGAGEGDDDDTDDGQRVTERVPNDGGDGRRACGGCGGEGGFRERGE